MNPQEMQALENFLNQLVQARGVVKDPQADSLIAAAVARQPDAAYLLVQRALLVEQALNVAKAQVASLQSQLQAAQSPPARGFLDAEAWGAAPGATSRPAATPAVPAYTQPAYTQPAAAMPPQAAVASPGLFGGGMGGMGGTMGTIAATAAGVAGGAFLFQGIEHMIHPGGGSGLMNQSGFASLTPPTENTTVNNFYGADPAQETGSSFDDLATDDTNWDDDGSSSV
jgi:hypothetical protein